MYNITIYKQTKRIKELGNTTLKQSGNTYFKQNKYWKAITFYGKAIQLIQQNQNNVDDDDDDDNIKMKLLLNRSLSYLKLDEYNLAYIDAQNAFSINPSCIKVQYRYLSCLTYIGEHQKHYQ